MSKRKDRIYAFINKPVGRGRDRRWDAFVFRPNTRQNDIEAFMIDIHTDNYFLIMESNLEMIKPYRGYPNACTIFYYTSPKYGRHFVNATTVSLSWEDRIEDGKVIFKSRLFKVR